MKVSVWNNGVCITWIRYVRQGGSFHWLHIFLALCTCFCKTKDVTYMQVILLLDSFSPYLCLISRAIFAGAWKRCFMASQFETLVIPGQFCKTLGLPWSVLFYICTFRILISTCRNSKLQSTATFKPPISYTVHVVAYLPHTNSQ